MWTSVRILPVLCAMVAVGHCLTRDDCPAGLHRDRYLQVHGDSCYYFMTFKSQDFSHAKRDCASQGGHLVYVKDKATQDYLYSMLRYTYHVSDPVWIGFTDDDAEAVWEWLDGSKPEYVNWASGQPGIGGSLEDCAAIEMDDGGKWHDFRCDDFLFIDFGHPYICQYGPYAVKTTMPPTTVKTKPPTTTTTMATDTMKTTTLPTTSTTATTDKTSTTTPSTTTTMTLPSTITLLLQSTSTTSTPATTTVTATTSTFVPTTTTPPTTSRQSSTTTTATTTPIMTTTTTPPTSTPPPTTATTATTTTLPPITTKCPPAICPDLDCGLDGFKRGPNGCKLCECDV